MNLVFEMDLDPKQKVVMLTLADHADVDGFCFPGQETLSRRSSIPVRTLRRIIQGLEEAGLIERERRTSDDGRRKTDGYQILPAKMAGGSEPTGQNEGANRPTVAGTEEPSEESSDTPPTPSLEKQQFEKAWGQWPKKSGKQAAIKAWKRALSVHHAAVKAGEVTEAPLDGEKWNAGAVLVDTITRFGNAYAREIEPQFIPHLATFLNGQRWSDPMPVGKHRGSHRPEPQAMAPRGIAVPIGHRLVRDHDTGAIIGTEPAQ